MDLQNIIDNALIAGRAEEMKTSEQLTLGEMILKLESLPKNYKNYKEKETPKKVVFQFEYLTPTGVSSWRGSYRELALEFDGDKSFTHEEFTNLLKETVGNTFQGYKGGDYVMGKNTPIWVANYGNSGETAVVDVISTEYDTQIVTKQIPY